MSCREHFRRRHAADAATPAATPTILSPAPPTPPIFAFERQRMPTPALLRADAACRRCRLRRIADDAAFTPIQIRQLSLYS